MFPRHLAYLFLLLTTFALAALPQRARAEWPHDPYTNRLVCDAPNNRFNAAVIPDGAGGAIFAFVDTRAGGAFGVAAQRLDARGMPLWGASGVLVVDGFVSTGVAPALCSDGAGGAIVAWTDERGSVFAQRVSADGVALWTPNGVEGVVAPGTQSNPAILADGQGGAILAFCDSRSGSSFELYAQRLGSDGSRLWFGTSGAPIATGFENDSPIEPVIASDGRGGAIVAWADGRTGVDLDIYNQALSSDGYRQGIQEGYVLCAAVGNQLSPRIAPAGIANAIVAWEDRRPGVSLDVYATRTTGGGSLWGTDGLPVATGTEEQGMPCVVPDGAGGVVVAWEERELSWIVSRVKAVRLSRNGVALWGSPALLHDASGTMNPIQKLALVPDGAGGAIGVWIQNSGTVSAQRVSPSGATLWPAAATLHGLETAVDYYSGPGMAAQDGAGGAVAAWGDIRTGGISVYAQRVDRYGNLGSPEPEILSVRDVPNDQGGRVKLSWRASYLDTESPYTVSLYEVYRSVPVGTAMAAIAEGALLLEDSDQVPAHGTRAFLLPSGESSYAWEYLATLPARHYLEAYSYLAPTTGDSTGTFNPFTAFMLVARDSLATRVWLSEPDSGYSVDNLPPAMPAELAGTYTNGATHLSWRPNGEPDLALYRLYRGTWAGFVPDASNRVASPTGTEYADVGPAGGWYKLAALDVNGNESPYAMLSPAGTVDVPADRAIALALERVSPNPCSSGRLSVAFSLPSGGPADLALMDVSGRRIAGREVGTLGPGHHVVNLAAGVRLAPGLYFVRLTRGGESRTERVTVLAD